MAVSKKKRDWLKKSLAAEKKQKKTDPEAFKKMLASRREQIEETKRRVEAKKTPTPEIKTEGAAKITPKVEPKVDEPVRLGKPAPTKEEPVRLGEPPKESRWDRLTTGEKVRLGIGSAALLGAAGLGAGLGGGAFAAKTAILSVASRIGLLKMAGKASTLTRGKLVTVPRVAPNVIKYVTNPKTVGLSKSLIAKVGGSAVLVGIIGSYPFAGFIKEESLQTLSFAVKSARDSGNLEDEQMAIDEVNEILNPAVWSSLLGIIPYANVVNQLIDFYKAAATKNEIDQNSLDKRRAEAEGQETDFQRERRVSDEQARERELAEREEDKEYYAGIEKEKEEKETAKKEEDERVALIEQQVWRLRREGKFDEADELELTKFR